ncbi:hypothetical protein KQI86_09575 [Clostridium sp. MSJ-11]|uniref:Outer membrane lipoprotein-sorting protein n=1 Tax=Clostridium mobile TaxID=2841512 RepID=A0ABS6EHV1_9CLOT|nr:hypothetical protein [Clostridium mobile]MBU5484580.1 hypothetical protein [Clostridium mobile]
MIKKRIAFIIMAGVLSITALTGCGSKNSILPETIVANAIEAENNLKSYYSEARVRAYDKDNKITNGATEKEWQDISNGKMKIRREYYSDNNELESVSTSDGDTVITYDNRAGKASIMKNIDESDMPINSGRQYNKIILQYIKENIENHDISIIGEEKINGMNTYHIRAVPKEESIMFLEQDMWINKKNWSVIKTIGVLTGGTKIEEEYVKIDFSPKLPDEIFTQKIPEGVKIENIEEAGPKTKTMTLKEVRDFLGNPFLYFPELSSYKIKNIKLIQYESEELYNEITMDYEKDGKPYFEMRLRKGNKVNFNDSKIPGAKEITIRGQKGYILKGVKSVILWPEEDISYSIIPHENFEKIEDFIKELNEMEMFN